MKKLLTIFSLFSLLFFLAFCKTDNNTSTQQMPQEKNQAADKKKDTQANVNINVKGLLPVNMKQLQAQLIEKYKDKLNITEQQIAQISTISKEFTQENFKSKDDFKKNRRDFMTRIKTEVLTKEQLEKFMASKKKNKKK